MARGKWPYLAWHLAAPSTLGLMDVISCDSVRPRRCPEAMGLAVNSGMLQGEAAPVGYRFEPPLRLVLPTRIVAYAWGEKYIGELLSMTLPALLAPGNLPAVASAVPCEVVILTEESVVPRVLSDPAFSRMRALGPVRLAGLDRLTPAADKFGMALAYVLHRGFADLGAAVTDYWLLFLNADFILADGSLRNLVRHLSEGKRLVASPSYCVNAEAVVPQLLRRGGGGGGGGGARARGGGGGGGGAPPTTTPGAGGGATGFSADATRPSVFRVV